MKLTLKRKTTAGVLAVFTKAIADLKHVEDAAMAASFAAENKANALFDESGRKQDEANEAAQVRRKLEELVQG